jgi:Rha family phage regulatory protein
MELQIVNHNGSLVADSREVAKITGKEHKELLRAIRQYSGVLTGANLRPSEFFIPSYYQDAKKEQRPCFLLTKKGCDMVANKMTGQKGVLFTAAYVTKFEEMEKDLQQPYKLPQTYKEALLQLVETVEQNEQLQIENEIMKPKALFAEAVETSKSSVLIGELSKILRQNGVDIGQNRLFQWLRENGYLIKQKGESFNLPTQKSMDLELFEIKKRTINNPDGSIRTTRTPKVTGKGQVYFVNKFIAKE